MELQAQFCLFGLAFFLFYCSPCKPEKRSDYEFPVYTTDICPRNETEWIQRSSAINCTKNNGYICIPNENRTELLEFCYIYSTTWVNEGVCLYLIKRYSRVDSYKCNRFEYGCPNVTYKATQLIHYPSCTSLGHGCFLAESTCERATTTTTTINPSIQETTRYNYLRESDVIWIVTLFGIISMMCVCVSFCLILYRCKGKPQNRNTKYDEEENNVNTPLMENQRDEVKETHAESQAEELLFDQWREEDKRRNGASPLYAACQNNHYNTVKFLLCNGANINLCNKTGTSPLFIACENGNEDVSNALIDNNANLNLCKIDKTSPLAETCYDKKETLVDLLLNGGADVNLCREDGTSPLLIARQKENEILAQKLLDKGAAFNLCRKNKTSPLSAVCQNGNESLVKCQLNKGADINLCKKKE
uniref:Uncharacterized protein n=2 Tax=Magallana gigas TaxID=29159 RepID=A0A8W8P5B0_MAGGI